LVDYLKEKWAKLEQLQQKNEFVFFLHEITQPLMKHQSTTIENKNKNKNKKNHFINVFEGQ
jgi:hypothetical protein